MPKIFVLSMQQRLIELGEELAHPDEEESHLVATNC